MTLAFCTPSSITKSNKQKANRQSQPQNLHYEALLKVKNSEEKSYSFRNYIHFKITWTYLSETGRAGKDRNAHQAGSCGDQAGRGCSDGHRRHSRMRHSRVSPLASAVCNLLTAVCQGETRERLKTGEVIKNELWLEPMSFPSQSTSCKQLACILSCRLLSLACPAWHKSVIWLENLWISALGKTVSSIVKRLFPFDHKPFRLF